MMCSQLDVMRVSVWKGERKGEGFLREKRLLEVGLLTESHQYELPLHIARMGFSTLALQLTQASTGTRCQTSVKVNLPERELRK